MINLRFVVCRADGMIRLDQMISVEIDYRGTEIDRCMTSAQPQARRSCRSHIFFPYQTFPFASRLIVLYFFIPDALPIFFLGLSGGPPDIAGSRLPYSEYEERPRQHQGVHIELPRPQNRCK
jgi:hypothetical protein